MKSSRTCGMKLSKSVRTTTNGFLFGWEAYHSASVAKVHWVARRGPSSCSSSPSDPSFLVRSPAPYTEYTCTFNQSNIIKKVKTNYYIRLLLFACIILSMPSRGAQYNFTCLPALLALSWHWCNTCPTSERTFGHDLADSSATCGDTSNCSRSSSAEKSTEWSGTLTPASINTGSQYR